MWVIISKSYTSFRLLPNLATFNFNDLKRRNGRYLHYFTEIGVFGGQLRHSGWS